MQFSANLGFLWADLPLPQGIRAAKAAGFAAVECHWPYDVPAETVSQALTETGLAMVGINTRRGEAGAFGLAAVPGRWENAKAHIDEALAYAAAIDASNVHVMAGKAAGPEAEHCFVSALNYACQNAGPRQTILIEPLNQYDAPDYFLSSTNHAMRLIDAVASPKLKLMFDCYHVQITEGDVCRRFSKLLPHIGHVQIAAVPDRGPPDHGELDYAYVLQHIKNSGYAGVIGAEYRPTGETAASLGWLRAHDFRWECSF
jgi:2-dehydrotetronate isomerase